MKKILALFMLMGASWLGIVKAQNPSFTPSSFTAEDSVTIVIDVTGTPMAGETTAYIWIFSNISTNGPGGYTNTTWTNSPDTAKMVNLGSNKWRFGFTGTTMFGLAPAQLKDFGFLVKSKDGSKQTQDYKPYAFDPLVFTPTMLRVFPAKLDKDDPATVNFDQSLGVTISEQRMTPVSTTITMFDDAGTQVGTPLTLPIKKFADKIWNATFIPSSSFTATTGHKLAKFSYYFNGTTLDTNGATITVSSSATDFQFTTLK